MGLFKIACFWMAFNGAWACINPVNCSPPHYQLYLRVQWYTTSRLLLLVTATKCFICQTLNTRSVWSASRPGCECRHRVGIGRVESRLQLLHKNSFIFLWFVWLLTKFGREFHCRAAFLKNILDEVSCLCAGKIMLCVSPEFENFKKQCK